MGSVNAPVLSIISFFVALNCSNVITNSNFSHFSIKIFINFESIGIRRSASGFVTCVIKSCSDL